MALMMDPEINLIVDFGSPHGFVSAAALRRKWLHIRSLEVSRDAGSLLLKHQHSAAHVCSCLQLLGHLDAP